MQPYIVLAKIDDKNCIISINSNAFLRDISNWVQIDSGYGDKYHHAQGNYFSHQLRDERGICRYLYTPDAETLWRERTQEEMDADWEEPMPVPTDAERIAALEEDSELMLEFTANQEYRLCLMELGLTESEVI